MACQNPEATTAYQITIPQQAGAGATAESRRALACLQNTLATLTGSLLAAQTNSNNTQVAGLDAKIKELQKQLKI